MAKKEKDLRSLTTDQLEKEINDTREELMNLRFQMSTGELTDFTRLRITRRQVARLMTLLNERETTEGEA
jgi:large subunit ribosomal protein L29